MAQIEVDVVRLEPPVEKPSVAVPAFALDYNRPGYQFAKRTMDVALSATALIIVFPIVLAIVGAIALTDGFPVVFRQRRIGKGGREFMIFKFRTMVRNAEQILQSRPELMEEYLRTYKITNDPRISKLGNFLRKSTLDELPQLLNVLMGDMSLVGPRPIVPRELAKYGDCDQIYLSMKPGCAGLWQCSGRSDLDYAERVQLDKEYFMKASPIYDVKILFRTLRSIVSRRGAV